MKEAHIVFNIHEGKKVRVNYKQQKKDMIQILLYLLDQEEIKPSEACIALHLSYDYLAKIYRSRTQEKRKLLIKDFDFGEQDLKKMFKFAT